MNLNKVMIIGRLGKKPEVNYIKPDTPVANFSVATSESYKTREGEKRETTEWHNIVAWRHTAKFAENYLDKGMLVYIEGRLQTRKWDGQDGTTRYATEVLADQVKILEKKAVSGDAEPRYENSFAASANNAEPKAQPASLPEEDPFGMPDDINDDLPF